MLLSYHNCPENATGRQPENLRRTATTGLTMGTTTLQDAVAKAVHRLAETGITGFIDKGGHQWTPEAYVSMDLRTTLHNTYVQGQQARSAEFGISTFQISSHPASRPLCDPYQGWICSWDNTSGVVHDLYGNAYVVHPIRETSYGEPAGIFGINCGHEPETFIDGKSVPRYTPLISAKLEQDNEAYLLTEKQRALERQVRQYRTEAVALHAAGQPIPPDLALKVKAAQGRLSEFCKDNGLTERLARTRVTGYNKSVGSAVGKAARNAAVLRKAQEQSGITGKLFWGSLPLDISKLSFDAEHTRTKHPTVTNADALNYINKALVTITRNKGEWQNYYSADGAAFVNVGTNVIRTAFTKEDFDEKTRKMLEVINKYALPNP